MIAITFALPAESSGLVSKLESKRASRENGITVVFGNIKSREVAILHTGVGRKRCRQNVEPFLKSIRPPVLISSGFAGALTDQLTVGDMIIAQNFSDPTLAKQLLEDGPRLCVLKLLTVDKMVDSAKERARIAKEDAAAAIDMETDAIAEACAAHSIPMISVRVVSDSPAAPFPAPAEVLFDITRQRTNFRRLIPYVLTHPSAVGRLIAFAGQISLARAILTEALVKTVVNIQLG